MLDTLGAMLKAAREARGLTLDEAEKATRIRAKYLSALEAGKVEALPSAIQARGFLRSYAQYLGLDAGQVLNQLDEALKPQTSGLLRRTTARPSLIPTSPLAPLYRLRRFFTPDVLVVTLAVVAVLGVIGWGGYRLAVTFLDPPRLTPTPEVLGPSPTPTFTLVALANITATPTLQPPVVNFSDVQVLLSIEQRALLRVRVDDKLAFEGLVYPGELKEFRGERRVEVTSSNGAGVRVQYNQRDLGKLGGFGEVLTRIYLPTGFITATPLASYTPTLTLTPSRTPSPTPTNTPTRRP